MSFSERFCVINIRWNFFVLFPWYPALGMVWIVVIWEFQPY